MSTIEKKLTERAKYLNAEIKRLDTKYADMLEGTVYKTQINGKNYYYYRCGSSSRYIKKSETNLVRLLMQKKYISMLRQAIMKELSAIGQYLTALPLIRAEEVYESLEEDSRQIVEPELESDKLLLSRWAEKEAEALSYNSKISTDYETNKGENVRSKSEYMIANMLYKNSIPYIYEKPLTLSGSKTVYPDFTILDIRRRREIILEHLGMMDDQTYLDKNLKKLKEYSNSGYILGDSLLITMESRTEQLNIKAAEKIVLRALGIR